MLIVGASGRGAAWSALRAGLSPTVIDLFADADLCGNCPARAIAGRDFPHGLADIARLAPHLSIIYTGALENRPRIVAALARAGPLWGNPPEVLRRIRSPENWTSLLSAKGLAVPRLSLQPALEQNVRWLSKPRRGASGVGIHGWQGETISSRRYLQERIEGEPYSAIYLGNTASPSVLLGVTRQWIGEPWLFAGPFRYCGSVGPVAVTDRAASMLRQLGQALVEHFGLLGLFGVDFILRDDVPFPVEINPRYTASVEILERATGLSALAMHAQAFDETIAAPSFPPSADIHGKAILFARRDLTFPQEGPWLSALNKIWDLCDGEEFADIPSPGTAIKAGQPILTFFARARAMSQCEKLLQEIARDLDRRLFG